MPQTSAVKISLQGFDERSTGRMQTLLKVSLRGMFEVSDTQDHSASLIDIDHADFCDKDLLIQRFDARTTVLIASTPSAIGQFNILKKPVKLDQLREALSKAAEAKSLAGSGDLQRTGTTPSSAHLIQKKAQALPESSYFQPDDYLLGWLADCLKQCGTNQYLNIITWRERTLVIIPDQDLLYTDIGPRELRSLAVVPRAQQLREKARVDVRSGQVDPAALEGLQPHRLSQVVASLAMTTSNGRLPAGTGIAETFYLECWPNFTRIPHLPNGFRIAATWHGAPQSLSTLYSRLDIPHEDINTFFCVAMYLGICGHAKRAADHLAQQPAPEKSRSSHILQSLLGHIARKLDLTQRSGGMQST